MDAFRKTTGKIYSVSLLVQVRSLRKAYEGELVAIGEEKWKWKWGDIPQIAKGQWLSGCLGKRLMEEPYRTGMPPFCAIDGSLTLCVCGSSVLLVCGAVGESAVFILLI